MNWLDWSAMAKRKRTNPMTKFACRACQGEQTEGQIACPVCYGRGFLALWQCEDIANSYLMAQDRVEKLKNRMQTIGGEVLRGLEATLTIRQIARRLKRSPNYVTNVMGGRTVVSPEMFSAIVQIHLEKEKEDDPI